MEWKAENFPKNLYPQQKKGLAFLDAFLKSDDNFVVIKGYAGTGKSYMMNYFINNMCNYSSCVTAPTHKAVRVIEKFTGKKGKTIHALLGLRPNVDLADFNIDNPQFDSRGTEHIKNYKVILVDECSQIPKGIKELLHIRAKQYNCKLIYVGDPAQLPPVKERISETFLYPNSFELTEIIRQEDSNPLLKLFTYLREDVKCDGNNFIRYILTNKSEINELNEGFMIYDKNEFSAKLLEYFTNEAFYKDINFTRYLAYSNDNILMWNKFIRNAIFSKPEEVLIKDDLLTGYSNIVDSYLEPIITNSTDYIVNEIEKRVNDYGIDVFRVRLFEVDTGRECKPLQIINHLNVESLAKHKSILNHLHFNAVNSTAHSRADNWRKFYKYKDLHLSMIPLGIGGRILTKDIDYGYGLTVHKSQGSTYDTAFLNILDIAYYQGLRKSPIYNTERNPYAIEMKNKLLYTGITRVSKHAILLI